MKVRFLQYLLWLNRAQIFLKGTRFQNLSSLKPQNLQHPKKCLLWKVQGQKGSNLICIHHRGLSSQRPLLRESTDWQNPCQKWPSLLVKFLTQGLFYRYTNNSNCFQVQWTLNFHVCGLMPIDWWQLSQGES